MNNQIYEMVDLYFGEKFVLYNDASFLLDDHQFNFFALFIRYIEALGKSLGLNVDQAQRLLQRINQKNMQYTNDDLDFTIEVSDVYTEFSDQLEIQYLSLLDIQRYSVDISGFYRKIMKSMKLNHQKRLKNYLIDYMIFQRMINK